MMQSKEAVGRPGTVHGSQMFRPVPATYIGAHAPVDSVDSRTALWPIIEMNLQATMPMGHHGSDHGPYELDPPPGDRGRP